MSKSLFGLRGIVVVLTLVSLIALLLFGQQSNVAKFLSKAEEHKTLPYPGGCCGGSDKLSIEMILNKSGHCSRELNLHSAQCNCESLLTCKFVVVSAVSDNHFEEAKDFIASVQTHMPETSLIVYNLGLNNENLMTLRSYCNVKVRQFNFSRYPSHVKSLNTYAWKPLIISEMYNQSFGQIILWADSSIRLLKPLQPLFLRFKQFPIIGAATYPHNFISVTHEDMKKYLGLNRTRKEYATVRNVIQAGVVFYWLNEFLQKKILRFWVDCALHKECIAPKGTHIYGCHFEDTYTTGKYSSCHRYDQAAFNAILTREFGIPFMQKLVNNITEGYLVVERRSIIRYKLLIKGQCGQLARLNNYVHEKQYKF